MRFIYCILAALVLLIVLSFKTHAGFKAHSALHIAYFYDGDTVKIIDASKTYKLRIAHIDAPERNQTYGKKSRRALIKLCKNTNIEIIITGTDKY